MRMITCSHCETKKDHPSCNPGTVKIAMTEDKITISYCSDCLYELFFSYCQECQSWFDTDQDITFIRRGRLVCRNCKS